MNAIISNFNWDSTKVYELCLSDMNLKIKIEIWSDIVCPFCYLGLKKLDQALYSTGSTSYFVKEWHSFQLDPEFPAGVSENTTSYLAKRKGVTENEIVQLYSRLIEQGSAYGINFQFDKALTFNTMDAHRLIQWSKSQGKTNELEDELFKAYFTHGTDLSKTENLISICESIGLSEHGAKSALQNQQYSIQIEEDKYTASQFGIRGVPYFIIDERFPISGAMPDTVFENTLKNVLARHKTTSVTQNPESGSSCEIDGNCN